jgi:hypothetical protein
VGTRSGAAPSGHATRKSGGEPEESCNINDLAPDGRPRRCAAGRVLSGDAGCAFSHCGEGRLRLACATSKGEPTPAVATADAPHAPRIAQTGAGNVAVLIVGDGNDVTVAGSCWKLWLRKLHLQAATPRKPLDLLIPQLQVVPFAGREAELAALHAWLGGDAPISVTGRIGEGGAGKTRLAIQLCAEAAAMGWDAGFARAEDLQTLDRHLDDGPVGWAGDVLMVVDYAARSTAVLKKLLRNLADRGPTGGPRLRILLLERHAATEIGWWHELFTPSAHTDRAIPDLLAEPAPAPLRPLAATEAGPALFTATLEAMHRHFGTPLDDTRRRLADEIARRPTRWSALEVGMMALMVAETGAGEVLGASRPDLARHLARRELGRIAEHDPPSPTDRFLGHLAALCTLEQGWSRAEAMAILPEEWRALQMGGEPPTRALVDALAAVLALDSTNSLPPIEPDLIGEALILEAALRQSLGPGEVGALIDRARSRKRNEVLDAVIRLLTDFGPLAAAQEAWLKGRAETADDALALWELAAAIPQETQQLAELALVIQRRITVLTEAKHTLGLFTRFVSHLGFNPKLSDSGLDTLAQHAGSLNNEGVRLSALGRHEEALTATGEAVDIQRKLAAVRPDAFLPGLAQSLSNLGNRLSALGRREEALTATEEAVEIRRKLVAARPDAFLPGLAAALNNLAAALSDVDRREEALAAAGEATELYGRLAAGRPDEFLPNLAGALNNLGAMFSNFGRQQEALAAMAGAIDIRRRLAVASPDAFLPSLAQNLTGLGAVFSAAGRREEALAATREAVELYRQLAAARPDAFLDGLAGALNNLGEDFSGLDRREEALAATAEAVELYRQLAAARPNASVPYVAMALNNLALRLSALARYEDALAATAEAVDIRRRLAASRPDVFLPDLARTLTNLGMMLSNLGRREAALAATAEAVGLYRQLAGVRPDAYLPDLAGALNNLGSRLADLGRNEDALAATAEVVELYRQLAAARPDAFLPSLALSFAARGEVLHAEGRTHEALEAVAEAIAALRPTFLAHPQAVAHGTLLAPIIETFERDSTPSPPEGAA